MARSIQSGSYEWTEASLIDQWIPADRPVIELGTGIGYVTCLIEQHLDESCYYISVGANPGPVAAINRTKRLNAAEFVSINAA